MEKLAQSQFGKFEGNVLQGLKSISGGGETGAGERCMPDGSCQGYQGDYIHEDGSGTNYWGISTKPKQC